MIINLPKSVLKSSDIIASNISKSFTYKMAAKTSWHRYGTKLRHCQPVYSRAGLDRRYCGLPTTRPL